MINDESYEAVNTYESSYDIFIYVIPFICGYISIISSGYNGYLAILKPPGSNF